MKRITKPIYLFTTMIRLLSLFFLFSLSTFNSYSTDQHAIVGWNYGNGKVMYCGLGYMMGLEYDDDILHSNAAKKLFVNMVKQNSYVTNPKVGIFAVTSSDERYTNTVQADTLIAVLARNGITGVKVTSDMLDTQAEIDNFDVLILGGSGMADNELLAGYESTQSTIKDFVQNNHGAVIFTSWSVYTLNRVNLPTFTEMIPVDVSESYSFVLSYNIQKHLPNDPLFNGVGTISGTQYGEYPEAINLKTGAIAYGGYTTYNAIPEPIAKTATNISTVEFTANWEPVAEAISYELEVSTDNFGTQIPGSPFTITAPTVSKVITGLPGTAYKYRVTTIGASTTSGCSNTIDVTTVAIPVPPTATTQAATIITHNEATLNGSINANNFATTVTFEYGSTASYGSTATASQSPVSGATATSVSYALTGLTQNTIYHYRVKAVNSGGTTHGNDQTFTTLKTVPTISSLSTNSGIIGSSVTIIGTNFSTTITDNEVYVGSVKATITSVTATSITFTIPTGAVTGKVKVVLNNGEEALSATNLVILGAPTITSTAPSTVDYGQRYNYNVNATTEGNLPTTITAPTLPAWLALSGESVGTAKTIGNPPANAYIYAVAGDDEGNIYAIRYDGTEIFKITPDGTTTSWKSGLISSQIYELHISNGYIYIPRYQRNDKSITRIPLNDPTAAEEDFASLTSGALALTDKDGWIYASDYMGQEIIRINETTKVKETVLTATNGVPQTGPFGLSFDNNGNLFIATYAKNSVLKYNGTTLSTVLSGLPTSVTSVKVDKLGNFYVALEGGGLRKYKPDFSSFEFISLTESDNIWGLNITETGTILYRSMDENKTYRLETGVTLQGTPAKSDVGSHNVVLRATNSAGYTEQTFTINVVDNQAPVISTFSPVTNATNVTLQPTLSVTFDEEVSLGTSGVLSIYNGTTLVKSYDLAVTADKALFTLSTDKTTVSIALTDNLPVNTLLSIGISADFVKDKYNNSFVGFTAASNTWQFTTMNKATQTITFPAIDDKTYGDATFTLGNATTDQGLTVTYTAADQSVVSITGNLATILKAGNTKITATQAGDNVTFNATSVERNLIVSKAPLKITAENKSKIYDGQVFSNYTATYTGFVKNETTTALTGTLSFSGTAVTAVNAGLNYTITPGGYTSNNYDFTFETGKLEISKRAITITADAKSKVYGNTDPALTAQVTTGTIVAGDVTTGTLTRAAGENVNVYAISKGNYTYGNNYNEVFVDNNLTINKRPITISADAKSKVYGNAEPALTAQVSVGTIVTGDAATGTLNRAAGENANRYAISKGSYTYGNNYDETFVSNNLTITKRPITITADAKSKVYGNSDPVLTAQVSLGTIVTGDAATGTLTRAVGENVNGYVIGKGTYTYGNNYDETFASNNLTISKRPITITAEAKSKVYGNTDPTFTAQVTTGTIVTGDAATGTLTRSVGENVNRYAINKGSYSYGNNYDETFVSSNLTITKRSITISADAKSKTYGNPDPTFTAQISSGNIVFGNTATGSLLRTTGENTGNYTISKGSYTYGSNYDEVFVSNDLIITKRDVSVTAVSDNRLYNGTTASAVSPLVGSLATGDVVSTAPIQLFNNSNAGTRTLTASGLAIKNGSNVDVTNNYTIIYETATGTINAKQTYISAPTLTTSKVYDGNTNATVIAGSLTDILTADLANVSVYATANYADANVGTGKTITVVYKLNGSYAANYLAPVNDVYNTTNVEITRKQLTISTPTVVTNKMVDGNTSAQISSVSYLYGIETVDAGNVSVSAAANYDNALAGKSKVITVAYTLSGNAKDNYLAPDNFIINNAIISEYITLSALATPTKGCEGSDINLDYNILTGDATRYKVTFNNAALNAGMQNVSYTNLSSTANSGTISFAIPMGLKEGTYMGTLTMNSDLGIESMAYAFEFTVNFSNNLLSTKFNKVVLIDNSDNRFVSYQWIKNGVEIKDANKQFYNDPEGLVGAYSVKVKTTDGQTLYTCEKILNIPSSHKISAYPNPLKDGQDCTIQIDGFDNKELENANLQVFNMQGVCVYQSTKVEKTNLVNFKALSGVYVGQFTSSDGVKYMFKIIVEK